MESGHKNGVQPSAAPQPRQRWVVWTLLFILLLALVTDLIFYTGYYASDDRQYLRGAQQLAESGRMTYLSLGTIRIGFVLPLALVARVTGQSLFLMAASIALYHLLVIAGTFWVGRLIHGLETGLLAAGIIAVCPLAVLFATMIVPDHAVTGLSLVAAGCLLAGRMRLTGGACGERSAGALCALGGFLFGLACAAKEIAVILFPVFLLVIASCFRSAPRRAVLRSALLLALGVGVAAFMAWAVFYATTGLHSPLQSPTVASRVGGVPERVPAKPYNSFSGRLERLAGFATIRGRLGFPTLACLLAVVGYPLVHGRSRGLYLTLLWLCVYMTWGTFSLTRYRPPPMQIRYFIFALPVLTIMLAFVVVVAARWLWRRLGGSRVGRGSLMAAAALGCLLAVAACYLMLNRLAGKSYYAAEVAGTRYALDFAMGSTDRPVVMSYWLSNRMLPLLRGSRWSEVTTTQRGTSLAGFADRLQRGFLYLDCESERTPRRRQPQVSSPLDTAVQNALAERDDRLKVRTIGSFGQFETRLAALRQMRGKSHPQATATVAGRRVFVREVVAAQPQAGLPGADP